MAEQAHSEKEIRRYVRFCEKYLDGGSDGVPWTLKPNTADGLNREFVIDEIWRPLMGYRIVQAPHTDPTRLCFACKEVFWSIDPEHRHTPPRGHAAPCEGLTRVPIVATIVNLPRRSGKTHSILSFLAARIFLKSNQRWAFLASAADQADELLQQKLVRPLSREHLGLRGMFKIVGTKLEVPSRNSWIEVLPATHGSITGRGNTGVAMDECRDVRARVASAVMPTIYDAHGWECPKCARQWPGQSAAPPACPRDGRALERWHGRLVFASSSGPIRDSDEEDWFGNLVQARLQSPAAQAHVYQTGQVINPSVSTEIVDASMSIVAGVPGLEDMVLIEASNQPMRTGDTYVTPDDVREIVDKTGAVVDRAESDRVACWFMDTSDVTDLTTIAVIVDDAREDEGESPLQRVVLGHLKIWDPRDKRQCPGGVIVEADVEAYIEKLYEGFTRLRRAQIDTRGRPWATAMIERLRKKPWGRKVEAYNGKQSDDDAGYEALRDYVKNRLIRIPRPQADLGAALRPGMDPHARLLRELPALKKVDRPRGGFGVVDPNANARGRNKNHQGLHRDAAAALAGAALLAWEERKKLATRSDNTQTHAANAKGRAAIGKRRGNGFWSEGS